MAGHRRSGGPQGTSSCGAVIPKIRHWQGIRGTFLQYSLWRDWGHPKKKRAALGQRPSLEGVPAELAPLTQAQAARGRGLPGERGARCLGTEASGLQPTRFLLQDDLKQPPHSPSEREVRAHTAGARRGAGKEPEHCHLQGQTPSLSRPLILSSYL